MDAKRDWGHAKDYIEMQWLMLQQEKPEDFVIATGVQYSVRDFVNAAAKELGMSIRWEGQGVEEKDWCLRHQEELLENWERPATGAFGAYSRSRSR